MKLFTLGAIAVIVTIGIVQYNIPTNDTCGSEAPNICVIHYIYEDVSPNKDKSVLKPVVGATVIINEMTSLKTNDKGYVVSQVLPGNDISIRVMNITGYKHDPGFTILKVNGLNPKSTTFLSR